MIKLIILIENNKLQKSEAYLDSFGWNCISLITTDIESEIKSLKELACTTACFPLISSTCPFLVVPFPRRTLTISAYFGNLTLSRTTSGPSTSRIVL